MAEQVTLQYALTEARGRRCQVHRWRGIGALTGFALILPLDAYQLPGTQIERERRELGCTWVEIDTIQVMSQDAVGYFSGREGMELLPVHSDKHIKGFTQKVAASQTWVEHGEAGE